MWTLFAAIAVNLFVCVIIAVPTTNDIAKSFQVAVHHQDLQSILSSIEERLRNLDNIYSMHLSSTIEEKLNQYQRKLDSIDTKIIRLESLVMLNLDKISENISTKNFKDDIAKTNLVKKVDAIYESISHRLTYMDRKSDLNANKIQTRLESTHSRLEKMDENFNRRNEDIEIELSDAIAAIDDLKATYGAMEENIFNNTNENFEVNLQEQMLLMKSFNDKSQTAIQALQDNTTKQINKFAEELRNELRTVNETERFLKKFKSELKTELNDYAVKVSEMNSENWKTGNILQNKQTSMENILNSTKDDIRSLALQLGNNCSKEPLLSDQTEVKKLNEKIDTNFEKVFSSQNLFMDSCYRLQMDESQIESKISELLEKLIETFEKKTAIEIKDITNLEKIIKTHDTHIAGNLYQINNNIVAIYEKMIKEHDQFQTKLHEFRELLKTENSSAEILDHNLLLNNSKEMEKKMTALFKKSESIALTMQQLKTLVETVKEQTSNNSSQEYFQNITQMIQAMEKDAYFSYHFNKSKIDVVGQNLTKGLQEVIHTINNKTHSRVDEINTKILDIFGSKSSEEDMPKVDVGCKCGNDILDIIDVRSNFDSTDLNSGNNTENADDNNLLGIEQTVKLNATKN